MKYDLHGHTFGRLTVIGRSQPPRPKWVCRCECGSVVHCDGSKLRAGHTRSCGCLHRELLRARLTTHGCSAGNKWTPEYRAWISLKTRCKYVHREDFKWYGARGITVCPEWQSDFAAFFEEIGPRPSPQHSVDRINNDIGYEPGNVRWATKSEQVRNSRRHPGSVRAA